METEEVYLLVLKTVTQVAELQRKIDGLGAKERKVEAGLADLKLRIRQYMDRFDRDGYKATDQRLTATALASEILIFDKLGYDLATPDPKFVLGVAALLEGRHDSALEKMKAFLASGEGTLRSCADANYLAGMIAYNTRRLRDAIGFFEEAFRLSPDVDRDWQSKIYVAELTFLLREPQEAVKRAFADAQEGLGQLERGSYRRQFLEATLYLKLGNCYLGNMELEAKNPNEMAKNCASQAIETFKLARKACPQGAEIKGSLLPVVVDYSLAQALMAAGKLDMDLSKSPEELFTDVFQRLRKIVLKKREETILAQSYFMLGTCAYYANRLSKDVAEIYLEHARHQTLGVPKGICFFSCITKELLSKDDFVQQLDFFELRIQSRK